MEIIKIKNLSVKYNEHLAIKNINLNITSGEYVCLAGKNGSGKSTLLKAITGLIKKETGNIEFKIAKSDVAYLAQNNMTDENFPATAKEIIMTGLQKHHIKPFYTKANYSELEDIAKKLKIENIINKKIGALSGGQRQRVLLARTLISNPKILLLDEPCSGLDSMTIKSFYNILDELHKTTNITIIMATHDLQNITNPNIRIVALEQEIVFDGNINDFKNQEQTNGHQ